MTYNNQQNRGPPVPKQCFICRDNLPGSAPRMIEFRNEGFKPDGTPKPVMYEPNSNVKHVHYPRPQAQQQGQSPSTQPYTPPPPVNTTGYHPAGQQQSTLPIDRIQPDAPREKVITQQTPIAKTLETNPDGTPKSVTMECDVCKQKGIPGQMLYGDAVGFDTTIQKYVWMFFDHDANNPTTHKVIHAHRDKPVQIQQEAPKPPAVEQKKESFIPTAEQLMDAVKAQMGFLVKDRDKEAEERRIWADKMLKTTQLLLANNEMYMKAIIRMLDRKLTQTQAILMAQFSTLKGDEVVKAFLQNLETYKAEEMKSRELEFAEDAVIFDALNIYDVREAAVPTTADKLLSGAEVLAKAGHYEPTPGLCSNCGVQVADINAHTCPEIRQAQESFKPTQEEMDQINAEEDETPDVLDDKVYRV